MATGRALPVLLHLECIQFLSMGAFTFFRTALKEQCPPRKQTWKWTARLITASSPPQRWAEMLILQWSLICRCGWWLFIKSHHKFLEHRFILPWSTGSRLARQSTHWGLAHVEQTRAKLMMTAAAEARLVAIAREGIILVRLRWFSKILTCCYCSWNCYVTVLLSSCRNPTVQHEDPVTCRKITKLILCTAICVSAMNWLQVEDTRPGRTSSQPARSRWAAVCSSMLRFSYSRTPTTRAATRRRRSQLHMIRWYAVSMSMKWVWFFTIIIWSFYDQVFPL